jgi:hypothetical protein
MGQDEPVLTIEEPANVAAQKLDEFCGMVAAAEQVKTEGLFERLKRAEALAFLYYGPKLIGIGALKKQHQNYTQRVFEKAQVRNQATIFRWNSAGLLSAKDIVEGDIRSGSSKACCRVRVVGPYTQHP